MSRYVIAADGGNSKTDLVVATTDGAVLARVAGAGTRPYLDGLPPTATGLAELARAALVTAKLPVATPVAVASFYLANVDFADEEAAMRDALDAFHLADRLEIHNDTHAVLTAGSARGWGIAVVAGAGINAIGVHPDGREERFLGIGEMSGDWGGGWAVAVAALGDAVRAVDGRGPDTALRALVADRFGDDPESVAIAADRGQITDAELFAFAPAVFGAALDGDAVAVGIVNRLADEVLDFVQALVRRMSVADEDVDVVLGGGTLQSGNAALVERIRAGVKAAAPKANLHVLDVPPVVGALTGALTSAGASCDAIERARASFRGGANT
jgi:N-acetylglucosamine kinase-like BadF-type ATPase